MLFFGYNDQSNNHHTSPSVDEHQTQQQTTTCDEHQTRPQTTTFDEHQKWPQNALAQNLWIDLFMDLIQKPLYNAIMTCILLRKYGIQCIAKFLEISDLMNFWKWLICSNRLINWENYAHEQLQTSKITFFQVIHLFACF